MPHRPEAEWHTRKSRIDPKLDAAGWRVATRGVTAHRTVIHGARDVRFEEIPTPRIEKPTDAIVRISAACVCGSDLWPYRGANPVAPTPMGHEYCGVVEEVGKEVTRVKKGQFVVGSFFASDDTCPHCRAGYHSSCQHRELVGGAQAPFLRVPLADGTLVAAREAPSAEHVRAC